MDWYNGLTYRMITQERKNFMITEVHQEIEDEKKDKGISTKNYISEKEMKNKMKRNMTDERRKVSIGFWESSYLVINK